MWRYDRVPGRLSDIRHVSADWRAYDALAAVLLLSVSAMAMLAIRAHLNVLSVSLIFLILVVVIALFADRWTSVVSALIAFLLFDFFFILPYYTFHVAALDHVLTLLVFFGVAAITSQLIYRVRVRTVEALARGRQMAILYELSQALSTEVTVEGILGAIVERVREVLGASGCSILMQDEHGTLAVRAATGLQPPPDDRDHAAVAAWALEHQRPAGIGQRRSKPVAPHGTRQYHLRHALLPPRSGASLYVPIGVSERVIGLLYIHHSDGRRPFSNDDQQLLLTFANQVALALERIRLMEEATNAAVLARSDQLKSALLSAVSHDLRTPLSSIKASATSLLQQEIDWSPEDRRDLLLAIDEETDRLTRLIGNLLDLTRIEAGELAPQIEWNDVAEVIRDTARRAQATLPDHVIHVNLPANLPLVPFDYIEIAQVLFNLIENAGKHATPAAEIDVSVQTMHGAIECSVADRGPGIPSGEEERIFDKFYRIERRGGSRGTGIGLSICRGIVEAHGGRIWVEPRDGGGAVFRFTLPHAACDRVTGTAAA